MHHYALENLLSPVILSFVLGLVAYWVKSDLKFPDLFYQALSIYLLFSIGLKGGFAFRGQSLDEMSLAVGIAILLGLACAGLSFVVARFVFKFDPPDASALSINFGSVSVVTYVAGQSFVEAQGWVLPSYAPALVATMEVPGIFMGMALYQWSQKRTKVKDALHEVVFGQGLMLLIGGFVIGLFGRGSAMTSVPHFFFDSFQGILMLFMMELGLKVGSQSKDVSRAGIRLISFSLATSLLLGVTGILVGWMAQLSPGTTLLIGILSASSSYIAGPAAIRASIPNAQAGIYLASTLGIVFPFNILVGIPIYFAIVSALFGLGGKPG
ncbi:MAG: sodium-dependent bicarbonate transport family permease [Oligoflexia bacterium]|nr:sodium-dependent bicarbonate transport family permease [Oligoflexia bacterium]